ncbi:MAG: hypothetical protein ACD_9C00181G0003 [uncultured bacterium]|nr:MAG: hypothetical protein ACD_9C00181G0003 [uncultured bacterium]
MTKFSESIIDKIRCEHIAPVPRWHFLFKSFAFWSLFVISVILGSLSFSVIVHIVNSGDWDIFNHLQGNLITSTVMLLPYFWLLFLILFAIIAYFNCKCTKQGYRFRRRWILLGSVALSVFFGSIFYALGMAKEMDRLMAKSMPFYDRSKHNARTELWLHPESGLLVGRVTEVDELENKISIIDEEGKDWSISKEQDVREQKAHIKKGKTVKVIGKKKGDAEFCAKEIRKCNDCEDDED